MATIKYYNPGTSQWETILYGAQGATGATGPAGTTNYNELTNLPNLSVYATQTYADNAATAAVAAAIDFAPETLNTLNELAAAINDDASFASTVTTALGTKAPLDSPTLITPVLGVATATSINGTAIPTSKTLVATDTTAFVATAGGSNITVASGSTVPLRITNEGSGNSFVVEDSANPDTSPFVIDAAGNVGIGTSSPSLKLSVSGSLSASTQVVAGATTTYGDGTIGTPSIQWNANTAARVGAVSIADSTSGMEHLVFRNPNGNIGSIGTNGSAVTFYTAAGERMRIAADGSTTINAIADATTTTAARGGGYMGVPPSAAATTGAYTIVAADAGEHIYSTATRTVTIPANGSVAFPVGTAITFIAATGTTVTIAITTDTLLLAGSGTTGSRTLAPFGMATAIKITSTSWIISGNGLT
jgi:hypothetical protein